MVYEGPSRLKFVVERLLSSRRAVAGPLKVPLKLLLHLEIPTRHFERGLQLVHPYNVIIHPDAELGWNVTIYHNVTIATLHSGEHEGTPVIGDDVTIFPNSIVLGNVHVGDGAVIGASSVVTRSVPAGGVVAGNPARPTSSRDSIKPSLSEDEAS